MLHLPSICAEVLKRTVPCQLHAASDILVDILFLT
jgi:hypothetical protein